jgi:hypothetical protein
MKIGKKAKTKNGKKKNGKELMKNPSYYLSFRFLLPLNP